MPADQAAIAQLTTTEAAVLALLAIEGERSGYDLSKLAERAIGHMWSPAQERPLRGPAPARDRRAGCAA